MEIINHSNMTQVLKTKSITELYNKAREYNKKGLQCKSDCINGEYTLYVNKIKG